MYYQRPTRGAGLAQLLGGVMTGLAQRHQNRQQERAVERQRKAQEEREGKAERKEQQTSQVNLLEPFKAQYPESAKAIAEAQLGIASGQATLGPESQAAVPPPANGVGPWRPRQYSLAELLKGKTGQQLTEEREDAVRRQGLQDQLVTRVAGQYEHPLAFAPLIGRKDFPLTPPVRYQAPAADWIGQADPMLATVLGPEVTNPAAVTVSPGGELVIPAGAGRRLTDVAAEQQLEQEQVAAAKQAKAEEEWQASQELIARLRRRAAQGDPDARKRLGFVDEYFQQGGDATKLEAWLNRRVTADLQDGLVAPITPERFNKQFPTLPGADQKPPQEGKSGAAPAGNAGLMGRGGRQSQFVLARYLAANPGSRGGAGPNPSGRLAAGRPASGAARQAELISGRGRSAASQERVQKLVADWEGMYRQGAPASVRSQIEQYVLNA